MELKPGIKIHGYTLESFINSGATAEVWRIKDDHDQVKALKIFSPVQKVDDSTLDLLVDEFKLLYRLDHAHILRAEIMGAYQRVPYIIMPFYNSNLATEMNQRARMLDRYSADVGWYSEAECLRLMEQIGGGLAYLHDHRIIHQDIKPENILFDATESEVKYVLTDFGISTKLKESIARMTLPKDKTYALTPAYAAPEQFRGKLDFKSDVFSLGVILFEMCEGRLPFSRHGLMLDSTGAFRLPEFRNETLSTPFKQMVSASLAELPADRPEARDLAQWAGQIKEGTIPKSEFSEKRNDKITVFQSPEQKHVQGVFESTADDNRHNEPTLSPETTIGSNPRFTMRDPENIGNNGNNTDVSKPTKKRRVVLYIIALLVALLSWFGYTRYNRLLEAEMFQEANTYFLHGKMEAANELYTTLSASFGDEPYYARKFLTDRILAQRYDKIRSFHNGRAAVCMDGAWGYIDTSGVVVIKCQYSQVEDFNTKTTSACKAEYEWGLIGLDGEEIRPFIYYGIMNGGNGQWGLKREVNGQFVTEYYEEQ